MLEFETHAVEMSAPLAIAAALVQQETLEAFRIQTRNAYSALDQARRFEARARFASSHLGANPSLPTPPRFLTPTRVLT